MPEAGSRIIESAREALAFAEGRAGREGFEVHIPAEADVKAIRGTLGLSQGAFARAFGVSTRTLQDWEIGRRVPSGPARTLLTIIAREPEAARRALAVKPRGRTAA